ncbi:hypothetical protein FHR53_003196 [Xanthomonas arboricola]|uniref:Uncharacterized protein n=1 Tax=Xanthomonas cannabis TaxID=1885674 RepID=A0ABR6JSB3_9XANT|nr:hypothetical protein [Xanthomonas cannabis]MBB5523943.1 hypothetical protein [Xanthomonas cannabis]
MHCKLPRRRALTVRKSHVATAPARRDERGMRDALLFDPSVCFVLLWLM